MRVRRSTVRRWTSYRRIQALATALVMLLALLPANMLAFADDAAAPYLCGHVHGDSCGYAEGSEGSPCTHVHDASCAYAAGSPCTDSHVHDANCGYVQGALCTYTHTHSESCGYVAGSACTYTHVHGESCGYSAGSPCTYVHTHDESCGYSEETGTGCTHVHTHDGACGFAAASPCTDVHTHDEACGYVEAHDCTDTHTHDEACGYVEAHDCTYTHMHDETCGYVQAVACAHVHGESCGFAAPVAGAPCSHICEILRFDAHTPGMAIAVCELEAGLTYAEGCAALPEKLPGTLACAEGSVEIPVLWVCDGFAGEAGTYTFRAELTNEHCIYTATDDELTEDVDESELPFITVTVPEPTEPPACVCDPAPAEGGDHTNTECSFYVQPVSPLGHICAAETPLYAEASIESAVLASLPGNTAVTVLSEADGWTQISCRIGDAALSGYVPAETVAPDEAAEETVPPLEERTLVPLVTERGDTIGMSGRLPQNAYITAEIVQLTDAMVLVGAESEAQILFAYDIRIMLPAGTEGGEPTEYHPAAENPVTVTITPEAPIEAPVEVVHIAEDEATGETTPQTVQNVSTTESSVEFEAEGFSVYVIRVIDNTSTLHTVNFPLGDYRVEYSIAAIGSFTPLTSLTVTLGSMSADSSRYDTLYFRVHAGAGFEVGTVTADGVDLLPDAGVYTLAVSGAAASTTIAISVTGVKITGTPAQGQTLTAEVTDDSVDPFTYAWESCDSTGIKIGDIPSAGSETLTLPNDGTYNGQYIRVVATDNTNTYTSAPVGPVTADGPIIFDLANGCVEIGLSVDGVRMYRGFNSAGVLISGSHVNSNKYEVMQSNNTQATLNRIILTGYTSPVPDYDLTLSGIKCDGYSNLSSGGIYANAIESTPMKLTLRLSGDNYVGRIHYATSGESSLSPQISSSLTITSASGDGSPSGSLVAGSLQPWSAAIGGVDDRASEASRNIYIKGGTITANGYGYSAPNSSPSGTSAIGGGGNGASNIVISGGVVIANNNGTGATIGGGGGNNTEGGAATVTISGGSVTATNKYTNGVAIGGGSSNEERGSLGSVTISGGTVEANGSIGGGSSNEGIGGVGTVSISGGNVTVESGGNIGGGNSAVGTGGAATVEISGGKVLVAGGGSIGGGSGSTGGSVTATITGGTVSTPFVTGGRNGDSSYQDATLFIEAASVHIGATSNITAIFGTNPATQAYAQVYCNTININKIEGYDPGEGTVTVTAAELGDGVSTYDFTMTDIYPDADGNLYFWLPVGYGVTKLTINDTDYSVSDTSQDRLATITRTSSTVDSELGAALSYGSATGYTWESSADGSSDWTPLGTGSTYTVVSTDLGRYIRVTISYVENSETKTVSSDNLLITPTPTAEIRYENNEPSFTLTARLLNGDGGSYSYQWQRYESSQWNDVGSNSDEYGVTLSDVSKTIRVVITDATGAYTSVPVNIRAPQLSITVPTSITVTVNGAGDCTAAGGTITNNSAVPIYLTDVTYTWQTDGPGNDADEVFSGWGTPDKQPEPRLKMLPADAWLTSSVNGTVVTWSGISAGNSIAVANSFTPAWGFDLNGGRINLAMAISDSVTIASVVYTVGYMPPA